MYNSKLLHEETRKYDSVSGKTIDGDQSEVTQVLK